MTRRARLHDLAAWTLAWPDLPALALGSFIAGYGAGWETPLRQGVLNLIAGKKVRGQR